MNIFELSITNIFIINAFLIILIGIFGIITRNNIIKILLSLNILETGVNLLIVSLGYTATGTVPILSKTMPNYINFVDPLPQALILTSIVIGFATTALGLAITVRYYLSNNTIESISINDKNNDNEVIE